ESCSDLHPLSVWENLVRVPPFSSGASPVRPSQEPLPEDPLALFSWRSQTEGGAKSMSTDRHTSLRVPTHTAHPRSERMQSVQTRPAWNEILAAAGLVLPRLFLQFPPLRMKQLQSNPGPVPHSSSALFWGPQP